MKRLATVLALFLSPLLGACVLGGIIDGVHRSASNAGSTLGAGLVDKALGHDTAESRELDRLTEVLSDPMKMSPSNEYYLGRTTVASLLAQRYDNAVLGLSGKGSAARAQPRLAYVQSLAQALLEAADRTKSGDDRVPAALKVAVVREDAPNAWSTPGGYTIVTTGLLSMVRSEDELAAVLSHELAHIVRGHGLRALHDGQAKAYAAEKAGQVAKEAGGSRLEQGFSDFVSGLLDTLIQGYPPEWEYEADARGAAIAAAAGYDPAAMDRVIGRLAAWRKAHGAGEGIAKTHPSETERTDRLAAVLAGLEKVKVGKRFLATRAARFRASVPRLVARAGVR